MKNYKHPMKITTKGSSQIRILRSCALSSKSRNYELDIFFHILNNYYEPELEKLMEHKSEKL